MHRPSGASTDRTSRGPVARVAAALTLAVAVLVQVATPHLAAAQTAGQPSDPTTGRTTDDGADAEVTATPEGSSVRITLTELTGVLGPGSAAPVTPEDPREAELYPVDLDLRVLVENDGGSTLDALRLVVEVHPPAVTRGTVRQALLGGLTSEPAHVHSTALLADDERLEPGEITGAGDRFARAEVDWADGPGGIHPVRVAVVRGTEVLDELVTAVVWLGERPEHPLLSTLVWPLDAPPWRGPGGSYLEGVDRELEEGARIDVLLRALERRADVPVVVAPSAHLLEDLADRSDGFVVRERQDDGSLESRAAAPEGQAVRRSTQTLRRLREVAAGLSLAPVAGSYADADLAALARGGPTLRELGAEAAVEGRQRLQRQLGREVDATTHLLPDAVTAEVLDLVPGEIVLVPWEATDGPRLGADPPVPAGVRAVQAPSGRLLLAVVADPYLSEAVGTTTHRAGPRAAAQRVVAESAIAWLENPGLADRTLLVLPPPGWDPSPAMADGLLRQLGAAPWLRLGSAEEQVLLGRRSPSALELAPADDAALPGDLVGALTTAVEGLDAAVAALPEGVTRVEGRAPAELRDQLLRATSRWLRDGPAQVEALVRDVQRAVDTSFGDVEVASGGVTLTSDTGAIPVTLQRTRGGPVALVVEVASQGRLLWPDGRRSEPIVLDDGTAQTVSFETRALGTGTFAVTVRVTDPSGRHELHRTVVPVRSTAISRPALTATGGVIVVLLLVGALRRRRQPPPLALVPTGQTSTTGSPGSDGRAPVPGDGTAH